MMILYWAIVNISTFLITRCQATPSTNTPKLLVVSLDGFRADYFERDVIPFLKELKPKGMYADYIINAFPSRTVSNHHTMATGLYIENHGVIDNGYYDSSSGKTVKFSYELFHYNNESLPIWILNDKAGHGRRSGLEMWPGGEFEYGGIKATFITNWERGFPTTGRIDHVISWFIHPETPINLGMVYIEEPDRPGHYLGWQGARFDKILEKVDSEMRYLNKKLNESGLSNINVVYVSDHGMATVTLNKVTDLHKYVNPADYNSYDHPTLIHFFPLPGKEDSVYNALKKAANETKRFDVYWRRDIPERYHYANNSRIGDILVINRVGYSFQQLYNEVAIAENLFHVKVDGDYSFGLHGYDNAAPDMHPFFFAVGPAFLPNCKVQPFNNVDLFSLFSDLLEIPQVHSDGTLDTFKECLRKYKTV